ncbi:MAG: alcohol dehydrogenase, partial [Rhodospirillales bacterium]|nr:alcohol dehydrogenase [Rhodospirillales bacterium]
MSGTTVAQMRSFKLQQFGRPLCEAVEPLPVPKGREVLVRVRCCGVCHSDIHLWEGHFDLGGGQSMDLSKALNLPRTLGHEISGTVIQAGAEADISTGEPVLVYPWIGCGRCALCRSGSEHLCARPEALGTSIDGGFSDHVLVPDARYLLPLGDLPEALTATYACSGLTAYSAVRKAIGALNGGKLLIVGAGGVGLAAIRIASNAFGVSPIVAEINRDRWDLARQAGAVETIDPTDADQRRRLMRQTEGGVGAAIDFVGSQSTVEFSLSLLRKAATLFIVGLFGGSTSLQLPLIPLKGIHIAGSYVGSLAELKELLQIARDGKLGAMPITERPLSDAQAALDELRSGRVAG